MTIELWYSTYEPYLATTLLINFIVALYITINATFSFIARMVKWQVHECCFDVNWIKLNTVMTILWTIFAIQIYFLNVIRG
jgi:hypothetical protein